MSKKIYERALGRKEVMHTAPRLEGKVKNAGIKNIKKKSKKG